MDRNEIRVPVKGGYIVAGRNSDPYYDGVYIVFETNDGDIMNLALVECKKDNEYDKTDIYCYEDVTTEEWTRKYSIQHEDIYEALREKKVINKEKKETDMNYFDIHVNYDGTKDSGGYSVFVKANVNNENEALQYAIDNHLFEEDGDEECVDYVNEIDEKDFQDATGR